MRKYCISLVEEEDAWTYRGLLIGLVPRCEFISSTDFSTWRIEVGTGGCEDKLVADVGDVPLQMYRK
ncbi:hypothetical protein Tco_0617425 [Tanacetum coccineum]